MHNDDGRLPMTRHNMSGKLLRLGARGVLACVAATIALGPVQATIANAAPGSPKDLIIKSQSNKRQYLLTGLTVHEATDAAEACKTWGGKLAEWDTVPEKARDKLLNALKVNAETTFIAPHADEAARIMSVDSEGNMTFDNLAEHEEGARALCEKPLG
ncbi:hypothetical protein F3087_33955 [Nocardia colli]|uniref:Uncharacterized protein n=1 Tax=Nocardia colli TaxID=2545717 RepID=A0A5N0E471_9NOCA|nr:hypothetical protein [Nocardia colli]KAA8884232.1 hypothetical protein F3087_33955 [Nocardia colli]